MQAPTKPGTQMFHADPILVAKCETKRLLSGLGLMSSARTTFDIYRKLRYFNSTRFSITVGQTPITFVTEDQRSKWFFHYRYRQGELHERAVTLELTSRLKSARVFADVGAHLGYFACIAGAFNRGLKVFCFEMNHNLIETIRKNLAENRISGAEIVNRPVSDRRKLVHYERISTDPGLSMTEARGQAVDADRHAGTETITLDEFFAERGVVPDLMKIDVQGAEMQALRGARRIIRERHPAIFLEVHPKLMAGFGDRARDLYRFLKEQRYSIHRFSDHRSTQASLVEVEPNGELPAGTHMLLCV
ncbi:MAG: FkbM family methyltransferase [Geminicoccaceae bacterium]